MASGSLPAPGTEYGPCIEACSHIDCAASREQATSPCASCGKPIGYEVQFFQNHDEHRVNLGAGREYEHARCAYERLEKIAAADLDIICTEQS